MALASDHVELSARLASRHRRRRSPFATPGSPWSLARWPTRRRTRPRPRVPDWRGCALAAKHREGLLLPERPERFLGRARNLLGAGGCPARGRQGARLQRGARGHRPHRHPPRLAAGGRRAALEVHRLAGTRGPPRPQGARAGPGVADGARSGDAPRMGRHRSLPHRQPARGSARMDSVVGCR